MIELLFHSDTNQQLAQQALEHFGIEARRGDPGVLEIQPEALSTHRREVETVLDDYNGKLWYE